MKQTYKKVVGLLLAIICVFGMTACGNNKGEFEYLTQDVIDACEDTTLKYIEEFATISSSKWEELLASPVDFARVTAEAWVDQTAVLGDLVSYDKDKIESEANEEELQVTVTVPATFEKNTGTISIIYHYDKATVGISEMYTQISETETFAGNMKGAVINTVMGVGMVFAVLLFLILVISSMKYVNVIGRKKEEPKKAAPQPAPVAPAVVEEDVTDDLELVAVIAAAIAASENTSTDAFVVRSIKKVNRSKWQRA